MRRKTFAWTSLLMLLVLLFSGCSKPDPLKVVYPETGKSRSAKLTIIFDDGYKDNFTEAFPIMRNVNVPGVIALVTSKIGGDPDYLTVEDCQLLWDNGWDLVSHTKTHQMLSLLDQEALTWELQESSEWIRNQGWNTTVLVSPYGAYNPDVIRKAQEYYRYHRALTNTFDTWPPQDSWRLGASEVFGGSEKTTPAEVKQWINYAYQNGLWLTLLFHHVGDEPASRFYYPLAEFREIIEYAANHPIAKVTYRSALGF